MEGNVESTSTFHVDGKKAHSNGVHMNSWLFTISAFLLQQTKNSYLVACKTLIYSGGTSCICTELF